jgi:hypothetical protein
MLPRKKLVGLAFADVKTSAVKSNRELHPSFRVELDNYSRHHIVKDLPADDLHSVLTTIGKMALEQSGAAKIVGGDKIRTVIVDLCDNPFSDCSLAASKALRIAGRSSSAIKIDRDLAKLYKK